MSMFLKIFFLQIRLSHRSQQVTTITEEVVPIPEVAVVATEVAGIAIKQSQTRASSICVPSCLRSDLRAYTYRSSRYLFVETRQ